MADTHISAKTLITMHACPILLQAYNMKPNITMHACPILLQAYNLKPNITMHACPILLQACLGHHGIPRNTWDYPSMSVMRATFFTAWILELSLGQGQGLESMVFQSWARDILGLETGTF